MRLHRAGDIDQQQQPARLLGPRLAQQPQCLADGAPRGARGAREVDPARRAGMATSCGCRSSGNRPMRRLDPADHVAVGFAQPAEIAAVEDSSAEAALPAASPSRAGAGPARSPRCFAWRRLFLIGDCRPFRQRIVGEPGSRTPRRKSRSLRANRQASRGRHATDRQGCASARRVTAWRNVSARPGSIASPASRKAPGKPVSRPAAILAACCRRRAQGSARPPDDRVSPPGP